MTEDDLKNSVLDGKLSAVSINSSITNMNATQSFITNQTLGINDTTTSKYFFTRNNINLC